MTTSAPDDPILIVRRTFDAASLAAAHPPRFAHAHKKLVHELACPPGSPHRGALVFSRWRATALPETVPPSTTEYEAREEVFQYRPSPDGVVEWTLNFADPRLFFAYGSALLAQDELQALEHPGLGSLCEALHASGDPLLAALTVENGASTPALVRGVERRCALATDPDLLEGRPMGLYGHRFARASADAVRRALRLIAPPTVSNILAIAAPQGGYGPYEAAEIRAILVTAYGGFRAARLEADLVSPEAALVVNTGHWGTGAFGGHKVLMAALQMVAARLAGVARLVFHTVDEAGTGPYREAEGLLFGAKSGLLPPEASPRIDALVSALHARGFAWGQSDGN